MSNRFKDIDIRNQTYYFFYDVINKYWSKQNQDRWNVIQKYFYLLHWICDDQTIKNLKYAKINIGNSLYLISSKVNGYFKGINKNKYLKLIPTNENKKRKNTWRTVE